MNTTNTSNQTAEAKGILTQMLLENGGDICALMLNNDQPWSSLHALTIDTANEDAGLMLESKDEENDDIGEDEDEKQEERFVRPPRLRFTLSKEAASDGFPSSIALALRWHPDHMQDRPRDTTNLSIRAAFDTKYDEYYVFRDWRPSQGSCIILCRSLAKLPLIIHIITLNNRNTSDS